MYRVLYIDDEKDLLEIAKIFLEISKEFSIDTSVSAQDALEFLDLPSYDAIISDYQMPGMTGIRFLQEVRSRFGNIPFILFTGRGREEIVIEALNSGADFFLQKGGDPVSQFAELTHKIKIAVEHRKTEEGLIIQNRLYSVLSATNKAIVHIRNKRDLFSEICRILVSIGGFRMAWIGLADTTAKKVKPVASYGYTDGYLDTIDISTEDIPNGRGPTGSAYRAGKYFFSNDITTDSIMAPWRQAALERGYRANAAFPFALGTQNAGVITVYSPKKGYFDDQIIGLLGEMSFDISFALKTMDEQEKRELAETALGDSRERFRKLFDHMIDGIALHELVYDREGIPIEYRILEVNPAFEKVLGIKKETIIGKTSREAYGVDEPPYLDIYSRVATESVPYSFETFFPGMNKHFFISVHSPRKGFFTTVFEDITRQKQTELELIRKNEEISSAFEELTANEEELRQNLNEITKTHFALKESGEKYRRIVDTANEGVWAMDGDLRTTFVNQRVLDILGYTREEILGEFIYSFMPEEDLPDHWQKIYQRKQGKSGKYERRFRRRDGTIVWALISATPLFDESGEFIGSFAMITDITEIKRVEHAFRQANVQLNILGGITRHDILNKVSVLLGYAALARKTTSDPDTRAFIDKVETVTKAIKSQIEFTRLYQDLGSHEPQWQRISRILPNRHEPPEVILDDSVNGVEIFADPMLEKVFSNLLDNSLRHGRHVTEISVSSSQSNEGLTLSWEDNGAGVPEGEKEQIFERGYGKNTGLGLFLVREILLLTGITIKETGAEGKGACFTIVVPKDAYRIAD